MAPKKGKKRTKEEAASPETSATTDKLPKAEVDVTPKEEKEDVESEAPPAANADATAGEAADTEAEAEDADMEGAVDLQPEEDEVVRNIFFRTAQLDA